jgi:hypothetical protein
MILISHRGNINGKKEEFENYPQYITEALKAGYNVEVDVWYINETFYLGHDKPQYEIPMIFLENENLWCHAKNLDALEAMKNGEIHYFWHQNDDVTITSKGFIWTYPNKQLISGSICVLPEEHDTEITKNVVGICSDHILKYKHLQ